MKKYQIEALFYNIGWEIPNEVDFPLFENQQDAQFALDDYLEEVDNGTREHSHAHDWRIVEVQI